MTGLALMMLLGVVFQAATPPRGDDPHRMPSSSQETIGCDGIRDYTDDLLATLRKHDAFAAFWTNPDYDSIQQMDRDEVEAIIDDGNALLEDLGALAVPDVYQKGNEGIMLLIGSDVDYVTFLGVDASTVPDSDQATHGIALILEGELLAAKTCPDEVDEVGGYVFYRIDDLENALDS